LKTRNLKKQKVKRKPHHLENQNVEDLKNSMFTLENLEEELKKYLLEIQLASQLK
jgi:predicted nuclease of restriction endonuclease-like (RecB) superfamily